MGLYAPEHVEDMVIAFEEVYLDHQERLVRPFPGVPELLHSLAARGYRLALLSNKRKAPGVRELALCGLASFFESVLFLEDLAYPKPDPRALQQSARDLGCSPEQVLYVGDSPLDMSCARAAGVASAAALWGSKDHGPLLAEQPDLSLTDVADLLAWCPGLAQLP